MAQWYVKEIAELTDISTQTLHHYDRIDLLKPSIRLPNNYRLYSEKDLLKLQQIIALKFLGFELSQIKILLSGEVDIKKQFLMQSTLLEKKSKSLLEASQTLKEILSNCSNDFSIHWETIIKLIEVYRMTENIEHAWVKQALTIDEIKQYVEFEKSLKERFSEKEKEAAKKEWDDIASDVHASLQINPTSEVGIALGKRCLDWVNMTYGKKYAALRTAIWEKGFKEGHAKDSHGLSHEGIEWLDKAIDAYCQNRIYTILNQIETRPVNEVATQWNDFLKEIYGDEEASKSEFIKIVLLDENVIDAAKNWLKNSYKI